MTSSPLSPELVVADAHQAIEWYGTVFDAKLEFEYKDDKGKMMHSMVRLSNGGTIFVIDDFSEHTGICKLRSQEEGTKNNVALTVTAPDAEAMFKRAVEKGGKVTMEFKKQFWGGVYGRFVDPFGHEWAVDQKPIPEDSVTETGQPAV